ncbi:MAG: hypothetical protein KDB21_20375 [Acidimicrobiales bacterium]|nr:hypothetical protein [Acidimicrobiales bacterium]
MNTPRGVRAVLAGLLVSLVAAACAGHAAVSSDAEADLTSPTAVPAAEPAEQAGADATSAATTAIPTPRRASGGRIVYGIEADTLNAWTPQNAAAAISGHMVMRSVYDLLAYPDTDGEVRGMLLDGIAPNDDASSWTLTVRPGITFHDGTPLDAAAVADNLRRHRSSLLTGAIIASVTDVRTLDDMTVVVDLDGPSPAFPVLLTTLVGYVASPTWLAAVDAGTASPAEPVGTGPFVFASYEPGVSFVATRNPNYWQAGQPAVDEIEFRIISSTTERTESIRSGATTIIHTDRADEIVRFREQLDRFGVVETAEHGETRYLMLNQTDPSAPTADVRVRRAMAMALDRDLYRAARAGGLYDIASGPFPPGTTGYLADTGFPTHDPDAAAALVAEVEAERGPIVVRWPVGDDEFSLISAELISAMWADAGIDVELVPVPQDQLIFRALTGDFDVLFWRNHAGFDPLLQYHWWHSTTASDPPDLSVNFSRIRDPIIDENLDLLRRSADPDERRAAAEAINRRFGEQVYDIWLTWPVWAIVHDPLIHGIVGEATLPDGTLALPTGVGIGGTHLLSQLWIEEPS